MNLNKVYKMLEINSCGVTDIKELAEESGLTEHLISSILSGKKYRAVAEEFKEDKAAGTKREYSMPEEKNILSSDYHALKERYLSKLTSGKKTLDEIHSYLIIDDVKQSHIEKLMDDLEKTLKLHEQLELEAALDKIDEIINSPNKWAIVGNNIIGVKPVPILDGLKVVGVDYLENDSFYLPEELFNVYVSYKFQVKKFLRGDIDNDLTVTERANVSLAAKFRELQKQGYTNKQIAELYEIKIKRVSAVLGYLSGSLSHLDDVLREERIERELLQELHSKRDTDKKEGLLIKCETVIEHNTENTPKVINSEYAEHLEQAKQMYELNIKGLSLGELSKEFTVSPTTVFKRLALYKRHLAEQG